MAAPGRSTTVAVRSVLAQRLRLTLGVRLRWDLQLLSDAKPANNQLIDFDAADTGTSDRRTPNGQRVDCKRTNGDCAEG